MREQIVKDKEFSIISRCIDNASKCTVVDVTEEYFSVQLQSEGTYEIDETAELFAMTPKGQLYFETIVKDVKDNIVSLWFPLTYKYLQRREYSRVQVNNEIELECDGKKYNANIIDLSAGGLKISTSVQLELLKEYNLSIEVENKKVECKFEPIRIEAFGGCYIFSGRFRDLSNYDRISIVQFCFMKQIEDSTK